MYFLILEGNIPGDNPQKKLRSRKEKEGREEGRMKDERSRKEGLKGVGRKEKRREDEESGKKGEEMQEIAKEREARRREKQEGK